MSEAMRIGLFTYGMNDKLTGIGRYAMQLSYAMRKAASDVEIVLINPYPHSPLTWYQDFPVVSVPSLQRLPAVMVWGPIALERIAARHHLDILHDPCGIAPFLPTQAVRRVVTIHDAIPLIYPQLNPWLGRLVFHTGVPWSRSTTAKVITDSLSAQADLAEYARIPKSHIMVIYPGVDVLDPDEVTSLRQAACPPGLLESMGEPYFLYVGAINPRKNVARIIEAVKMLQEQYGRTRLIIVGPDKPSGIPVNSDVVQYIGYVDQKTLDFLYVHASAVLVPSLYEGFGFPALEAMARHTVAIVSNVSSLPEVTRDGAMHVDPHSTKAWVTAMHSVLIDQELREGMARRGYSVAQTFTWEKAARDTIALYRQVLSEKPTREALS